MADLEELKKAAEDAEKAKKAILQLLWLNGITAFNGANCISILEPELERLIKGKG